MKKPLILLSNDDGIYAEGLNALKKEMGKIGEVCIVAPEIEKSAVGHAITLRMPIKVKEIFYKKDFIGYGVNGTPADCIKIAVSSILKKQPDIVVSGINLGSNMGMDILYSGTISAATEAAILGIPSFAVSLTTFVKPDFSFAAKFSKHLAHIILNNRFSDKRLSPDTILNVNIPNVTEEKIKGIKITFQSKARYHETYEKRIDPRQQVYYWLTGEFVEEKNENESDVTSVKENYISITPLKLDLTNYEFISALKKWRLEKNLC